MKKSIQFLIALVITIIMLVISVIIFMFVHFWIGILFLALSAISIPGLLFAWLTNKIVYG